MAGNDDIVARLDAAHKLVSCWPEDRMAPGAVEAMGKGLMDLLALRNMVPEAITTLTERNAQIEWLNKMVYAPGRDIDQLRERLGGVQIDNMNADNLAIMLCTYFDDADEEIEDETCWGPSALNGANATLDAIHAHYATALAERDATIERLKVAIFGSANYDPALTIGCFVEMALSTEVAGQGALARATTAERERDEARAEVERLRSERDTMEEFIRAVASKKHDGEMFMSNPPKPVISYTAARIVEGLDRARAALQQREVKP